MEIKFNMNSKKYLDIKLKDERTPEETKVLEDGLQIHYFLEANPTISFTEIECEQLAAAANRNDLFEQLILAKANDIGFSQLSVEEESDERRAKVFKFFIDVVTNF